VKEDSLPPAVQRANYLCGLVLVCIVGVSWPASQAADIAPAASHPPPRLLAQAGGQGSALPRDAERWPRAPGAGWTALWAQRAAQPAEAASDSQGIEFWLAFPGNLHIWPAELRELGLLITGSVETTGTVTIPGLEFSTPFTVTAGTVTTVALPPNAALNSSNRVENKGIHVTARDAVTVYGLNRFSASTDAYLGLPTDGLGTEYIVLAYQNSSVPNGSQFAIVATADETAVTITPSVTTGERPAGVPYGITLQQGQTYQLRNHGHAPNDLSGTVITSDKPIAVFGGHKCANVPPSGFLCHHLVEQLPPVVTWGTNFVTMPLATRLNGDTFRFLALVDGTNVSVNGVLVATLGRGQLFEQIIATPAQITADQPILVAQYANGIAYGGMTGGPFMMVVPPTEQFLGNYTITTPTAESPTNFVNVVTRNAAVGAITLDQAVVPAEMFVPIGTSGFSGAQVPIGPGAHDVTGPLPFGVLIYGFSWAESYGYPGGMLLAPVAMVARLDLVPETAINSISTEHCLTALLSDREGKPVAGVGVEFTISGANPTTGFAATAASGQAQFCYTGVNLGTDTIAASVGTITDTATKIWSEAVWRFSDGVDVLTVDSTSGEFTLSYMADGLSQLCSGNGTLVADGVLTVTSSCREDLRDVIRAVGPVDVSVSVELIDYVATTGDDRVIRQFFLTRQADEE
jgi:hypothetical protein